MDVDFDGIVKRGERDFIVKGIGINQALLVVPMFSAATI